MNYEGITNFKYVTNFDKKSIGSLPTNCMEKIPTIIDDPASGITSEPALNGANTDSIVIIRLIVAVQYAKYYTSISNTMNATDIHYKM